ncbi:hypothetical protein SDC9_206630 [bioreactor metagenome]|uniref:Uncharacterized protein n=1 Tax=bioreactor metagenome TaxID=1076179 RepID=A0A645JES5_9ZZZZ
MYEKNVPEDVKAKVEEAITKIKDGTIEVTTAYGMAIEDILAIQNSVKPS